MIERRCGEDLAVEREQELPHVLAADPESTTVDARDNLIPGTPGGYVSVALGNEVLHASHLVPRRTVVAGNLGLDDRGRP